jgi:hypothetical protein
MVSWYQNLNKRVSWNDFCGFLDCYGFKVSPTGKIIRGAKVNQQSATSDATPLAAQPRLQPKRP